MKKEKPTVPNNLRVAENGRIYCEDGRDVAYYILNSRLGQERTLPAEIVVLTREDYLALINLAQNWIEVRNHLIMAA